MSIEPLKLLSRQLTNLLTCTKVQQFWSRNWKIKVPWWYLFLKYFAATFLDGFVDIYIPSF